jgi:hypothetical protein
MTKKLTEQDDFSCKVEKWMDSQNQDAIDRMFDKIADPPGHMLFHHKIDGEKVKIILLRTPKDNTANDFIFVTSDERDVCKMGVVR